jgi:hypothetical protein
VARRVSQAKSRGSQLMKVPPAEPELVRLRPHLKLSFFNKAAPRWQSAAKLDSASVEFRDKVSLAIIRLPIGSIAASHLVRPHDREEIERSLRRECKATRLIAEACRLYGSRRESAPRELERALWVSIYHKAKLDDAADQLKQLRRGRAPYQAFEKFVCLVGEAYETASGKSAIVKMNNARAERCSGPFGELLEAVRADAAVILERAGLKTTLSGSRDRNTRLDYARKVMQTRRPGRRSS